jgi:lipoprotein-anchoring transpeptidase ErfK/SrfK
MDQYGRVLSEQAPAPKPERRPWKWAVGFALSFLAFTALFFWSTGYGYVDLTADDVTAFAVRSRLENDRDKAVGLLRQSQRRVSRSQPRGTFIVIDRINNKLYLRDGDKVLLTAVISAGAGSVLQEPGGKRQWIFDTPVGRFRVVGKRENPVWVAPDWEYIESKQPYPRNPGDRAQVGMLGEYALDLDIPDYMIHGTLYTRLLGRNVTHGCIRVGRDDLRTLYKKVPINAQVFIY